MNDCFVVAPEVARALAANRPVVALETTLVTHGLPHPGGLQMAAALEREVIAHGAVPATIGVLEGRVRIGMSAAELERLATLRGVPKLNLSNFAAELTRAGAGSTTVAATIFVAAEAGIRVFATGGIGGVHRDIAESGDVSADLTALARYRVAVVCAGAKAILDLARTVEMLETLGVPVYGVGTERFPAFYHRDGGAPVDRGFDSVAALADAVRAHWSLGFTTGVVVANPVPAEGELARERVEQALAAALADASSRGVRGRAITPFLLERLGELTGGASVTSNRALLSNNARVAAELAVAMARAER